MLTQQYTPRPLRPCPFCGGKPELFVLENLEPEQYDETYFVKCADCGARGSRCEGHLQAEDWWNGERLDVAIAERGERLRDGEPCHHPGCLPHISHPCEGCGHRCDRSVT